MTELTPELLVRHVLSAIPLMDEADKKEVFRLLNEAEKTCLKNK